MVYPVHLHSLFCAQAAAAIDPDNEFVQDVVENGIDNTIVLSKHVPADVQHYIKTWHDMAKGIDNMIVLTRDVPADVRDFFRTEHSRTEHDSSHSP